MKKIMFNDDYGLTQAVIDEIKTMTSRLARLPEEIEKDVCFGNLIETDKDKQVFELIDKEGDVIYYLDIPYQVGEVVAVSQAYKDLNYCLSAMERCMIKPFGSPMEHPGWNNKMFVSAGIMKHHIEFTSVKFERLRSILDADCFKEGIVGCSYPVYDENGYKETVRGYTVRAFAEDIGNPWSDNNPLHFIGDTPKTAFIVLCSKLFGKQLLKSNPFTLRYTFKKVD